MVRVIRNAPVHQKSLARGRTDRFSNMLVDRKIARLLLLIYSFKFRSDFLYFFSALATPRSAIRAIVELLFSPVTLNFYLWTPNLTYNRVKITSKPIS